MLVNIYYLTVNNHCDSLLTVIELVKVMVSGVNYILLSL